MNSDDERALERSKLIGWAGGGTIVTRTRRLARELLSEIGEENARAGKRVFETPDVLPVEAWFARLWESADPGPELLRDSAELHLWREAIATDLENAGRGEPVTRNQVAQLAVSAAEAWKRIRRWREPRWEDIPLTPDVEAFRRWSAALAAVLGTRWITVAQLPDRLAAQAVAVRAYVADQIVFVGFERIEPALRRFIDALSDCGVEIIEASDLSAKSVLPRCVPAADIDAEVRRVAAGVRADIERDPLSRIGILAADLSSYRSLLERYLATELDAASLVPVPGCRLPPLRRVFDLAGAPALSDYGIVAHALDLLHLSFRGNSFERLSRILLAPYPRRSDDQEREHDAELRVRVELKLRRDNRLMIGLEGLAESADAVGASEFAKSVRALGELLPSAPVNARPSVWARYFVKRLVCFGWPGPAVDHDGDEGVAFGRWREVIDEFAALDLVCGAMTSAEALTEVRRLCSAANVQAPSGGLSVQAMGLLDAAGLRFDKVYVVGMTADVFPAPTRPHPLLPAEWQRTAGLPLASPEVEGEFAASVWRRVRASCSELVVSWPLVGERSAANVSSPVLAPYASEATLVDVCDELAMPWYARAESLAAISYDVADCGDVPPALVRTGGTSLLKDHSACPFRSFAAARLLAGTFDEPEPEPKATTRGELVHRALELVWADLGDSQTLRSLDDAALSERVRPAVRDAVMHGYQGSEETEHASLMGWLAQQVAGWLRFERDGDRAHWRIGAVEERADLPLGLYEGQVAVSLSKLSVDRIDLLSDGSALIIDYKTSSTAMNAGAWAGDRPKEPQLPIYAVALRDEGRDVGGVAFANIEARDKVGFRGISEETILAKAITPPTGKAADDWSSMESRIDQWRSALVGLAEDYAGGNARVAPRELPKDCLFCRREPLCRVFETNGDDTADDTGDGGGDDGE